MSIRLLPLAGLGVLAVLVTAGAITRTARERIASVGLARLIARWFTGTPWHGGHVTDAGWNRPGRKVLTATGHARAFWHRKGKHRAAIRTTETLGPVLAAYGLWAWRTITVWLLAAAALAGLGYGAWRARKAWQARTWRRSWLYPLHKTLAPMVGVPLAVNPASWLALEPDRSRVAVELPVGFRSTRDLERLERAVSDVLAIEAPDVEWDRSGAKPNVIFTRSQHARPGCGWPTSVTPSATPARTSWCSASASAASRSPSTCTSTARTWPCRSGPAAARPAPRG